MRSRLLPAILLMILATTTSAATTPDWSGWYVGIFGGYLDGKLTANDPTHLETTGNFDDDSPLAGLHAGLLKQTERGWVYGGEFVLPLYIQTGSAEDIFWFPDADPPVTYEADYQLAALIGGRLGRSVGSWLPYAFGALGLASVEGRSINVNDQDQYEEGFEQSASATHLVFQLGGGADWQATRDWFAGLRVLAFISDERSYEMPWNEGEDSEFGLEALLVQLQVSRCF
ncbi:outer membrane beta-barrel protein [bacterium]|nr:outer membrane beta-barrel protein [bacterium]